MRDRLYTTEEEATTWVNRTDTEEFPLPVAEDWDQIVDKANKVAEVIDKHLDFEQRLQGIDMRPSRLCPEQKVSLASDLSSITS